MDNKGYFTKIAPNALVSCRNEFKYNFDLSNAILNKRDKNLLKQ